MGSICCMSESRKDTTETNQEENKSDARHIDDSCQDLITKYKKTDKSTT